MHGRKKLGSSIHSVIVRGKMEPVNTLKEMNQLIHKKDMLLVYFGSNTCGVSGSSAHN
jgi:hypothetical protein